MVTKQAVIATELSMSGVTATNQVLLEESLTGNGKTTKKMKLKYVKIIAQKTCQYN